MSFLKPQKAMLLAAGRGERLRPLTDRVPKCMVPVWGKPVLEHNIEHLARFGITDIVINLCYQPQAVMDYFEDGNQWGVNITYSIEQEALGTSGGVKRVESFFDHTFLIWYGDNLSNCNLEKLSYFHFQNGGNATMALFYREDPTASGIVGLDENCRITRFLEKPKREAVFSHWVNAGIYILEPEVLEAIPENIASDFGKEIFPQLLSEGIPMYGYQMGDDEGLWWIDTPEDLNRVDKIIRHGSNSGNTLSHSERSEESHQSKKKQ